MSNTKNSQFETKKLSEIEKLQSSRDFTNGMKMANKILKKNPKCAEAIAWKSYFTYMKNAAENKDLALGMFKEALTLCKMQSPGVWKIYSILYKEMQDFPNALKCASLSLKQNSNDIGLLNEIANLNLYMRNYIEFLNNTRAIFKKNPSSFSIARYVFALAMTKNYNASNSTCEYFQQGWRQTTVEDDLLFRSEFCLFRCILFIRSQQYKECLEFIEKSKIHIRDFELITENKIICLRALNRDDEVLPLIHELLRIYPENGDYFDILESLFNNDKQKYIDELIRLKDELKSHYAHVRALELMEINDERFKPLLIEHVKPLLVKGAPSIYMTIRELSKEKLDVALEYAMSIEGEIPITSVPILHLFAAHVLGYRGNLNEALEHLEIGLKHTPTCIELIAWQIRFLSKHGRIHEAIKLAHDLREADPNDRNTNLLLVKILFLGGKQKEAEYEAILFSGDENGKPLIYETQFNIYYLQAGFSALRCGDYEFAEKMYSGILTHFEDYRKNEYNYLGWSWRRPRALLEMIETINSVENNSSLARAIEILLTLTIKDGKQTNAVSKSIAQRALIGLVPRALYMACIIFAANKMVLPALRCFLKISGTPYIFAASPIMKKLIQDQQSFPQLIQDVFKEEYHEFNEKPSNFHELFYLGKGFWALGQIDEAEINFNRAIDEYVVSFKDALELYAFAAVESGNEKLKTDICDKIKKKYPDFEFDAEGEPTPFVPNMNDEDKEI